MSLVGTRPPTVDEWDKADLKEKKTALKKAEKEVTTLEAKKAKAASGFALPANW